MTNDDEKLDQHINQDKGKTKWELLPYDALELVAQVLTQACTRPVNPYLPRSWERGMEWSRAFGSAERHARDFAMGKRVDNDTGLPVAAHAAFRWLQILAYQLRDVGVDDMAMWTTTARCEKAWEIGDKARVGNLEVKLLNKSSLEPGRWVVRTEAQTTFYADERDLLSVDEA